MTGLNKSITRWQGTGLLATTLLGTGVFILPQLTIAEAGDKALVAWLILIVAILPLGVVFAQLGKEYVSAAGPAHFVAQAFGTRYGQLTGILFLCVVPLGAPAALIMTLEFVKPLITLSALQSLLAELSILVLLFVLNVRGVKVSGVVQLGLTIAILGVVLMMMAAWATNTNIQPEALQQGTNKGMINAFGLAIWSFLGIEAVTHLSAEFKDVKRDFVPAVLSGLLIVGVIFLACTFLSTLAPKDNLAMVGAYERLLGSSGRWVIGGLGLAAGVATVNVYVLSLSRLTWTFSQEGLFPKSLQRLNNHQVPIFALLLVLLVCAGVLITSYLLELPFEMMIRWTNGVFVLIYFASMLAAWHLLKPKHRPAIVIGIAVCIAFAISLGSSMIYAVSLALLIGSWLMTRGKLRLRLGSN